MMNLTESKSLTPETDTSTSLSLEMQMSVDESIYDKPVL